MQARSASQASSVAQYSPNMSELLGFLPTPKAQPDAPTGQDPRQKPSSASSYSFGVRERAGASPHLSPLWRQKAPSMSQNCLHIGKSLRKQRRLYCIVAWELGSDTAFCCTLSSAVPAASILLFLANNLRVSVRSSQRSVCIKQAAQAPPPRCTPGSTQRILRCMRLWLQPHQSSWAGHGLHPGNQEMWFRTR